MLRERKLGGEKRERERERETRDARLKASGGESGQFRGAYRGRAEQ